MGLRVFPVAGGARYTNDWQSGRVHNGNDLFAVEGTPLLAVDDGLVRYGTDGLGGNVANLYATDGTRYYYAHQSAFASGAAPGTSRNVRAGDVIGYVGTTGNAQGTPAHVHFEVHPSNGEAVNPFPYLSAASVRNVASPSSGPGIGSLLVLALGIGGFYYLASNPSIVRKLSRA